jgi:hypothetical protein
MRGRLIWPPLGKARQLYQVSEPDCDVLDSKLRPTPRNPLLHPPLAHFYDVCLGHTFLPKFETRRRRELTNNGALTQCRAKTCSALHLAIHHVDTAGCDFCKAAAGRQNDKAPGLKTRGTRGALTLGEVLNI